jgi:alkanesulfonate monooxygenase SsuD/methylene tetrahydromethanopterin reductase-like flavin-dependent oxidoreductase (luciferase family)
MRFGLQYDLRNPPEWRRDSAQLYRECLGQIEWADRNGFQSVSFPEHHFTDDWYLPSSTAFASAVAARTKSIRIELSLVLLPLKHPVQLAEDLAVIDILANGRLDLQIGTGYRPAEYEGYGIDMKSRPGRMDEAIEIIKRCWTEEDFSFDGRYWKLKNVRMTPKPVQKPRPSIVMGGASPASARRAAKIADGYNPLQHRLYLLWRDEMVKNGRDPGPDKPGDLPSPPRTFFWLARDPKAAWKAIGKYAMQQSNSYADYAGSLRFAVHKKASHPDDLLADGSHGVLTPDEAVDIGKRMEAASPHHASMRICPLVGGCPAELGQECMELLAKEVIPHFGK